MPNDLLLSVEHLTHRYGQRVALNSLSLGIAPRQIVGVLGPNGSGKSSLFRILCTLTPPQAGSITYHLGRPMDIQCDRLEIRRHIGVVFQSPSLDRELTAEENLRHHGHMHGLGGRELSGRINEMLQRFDLTERRGDRVAALSGGLRRRVELAKGLLSRPSVLIMDEPSTGLDPGARMDMRRYLTQVRDMDGVTVLLTTHLMDEAEHCDRLAILDAGRLVATDTPAALKAQVGGEVLTLFTHDPAGVAQVLKAEMGIEARQVDGSVRVEQPELHHLVPAIAERLEGVIDSMSLAHPTLEDVFIKMTGRHFETT